MSPTLIYLPTMSMTLVRRVSAHLPYNHYLFRVAPKHTKAEIKEYLEKVYNVSVARVTTSISMGKTRRVFAKRAKYFKLKDYKRAMVQILEGTEHGVAPAATASTATATATPAAAATPASTPTPAKVDTDSPSFMSRFFGGGGGGGGEGKELR